MYNTQRKLALAAAIALSFSAFGNPAGAATASQDVLDARQETQIWTTYALSPYLRARDITVTVHSGKAVLSGKVNEEVNKDLAKQIALGVTGITAVDNQIVVQGDYVAKPEPAERGFAETVDDASIKAAVKSKLLWSKHTKGLDTEVSVKRGRVVIAGSSETLAAKSLATRLAQNTRGVVSVDNQLKIVAAQPSVADKAKAGASEAGQDISDAWITTKVKSTFIYSSNVDSSDISVDTKDGVVSLSGKVGSGAERALAIEFAENIRGVHKVNASALTHR